MPVEDVYGSMGRAYSGQGCCPFAMPSFCGPPQQPLPSTAADISLAACWLHRYALSCCAVPAVQNAEQMETEYGEEYEEGQGEDE